MRGNDCSIKWSNQAVEHYFCCAWNKSNVPRTFVEQSESVNALIYIVEHPWNIRGTLLNEML